MKGKMYHLSAEKKQKPHNAQNHNQQIMMLLKIQKQRKKNTQCEKKSSTPNLPKTIKV